MDNAHSGVDPPVHAVNNESHPRTPASTQERGGPVYQLERISVRGVLGVLPVRLRGVFGDVHRALFLC